MERSRQIACLEIFADGKPRDVPDDSRMDIACIKWLFDNGLLAGIDTSDKDEVSFMQVVISERGLQMLEHNLSKPKPESAEASIKRRHPILAAAAKTTIVAMALTAIRAFLGWLGIHGL